MNENIRKHIEQMRQIKAPMLPEYEMEDITVDELKVLLKRIQARKEQ